MASPPTAPLPREDYGEWLKKVASKIPKFEVLNTFANPTLQPGSQNPGHISDITAITFSDANEADFQSINESELEKELEKDVNYQLFIVENISPTVLKLLGYFCDVDPQFFLDYLDASLEPGTQELKPLPWYRLESIEEHLPVLRSVQPQATHIHMPFIGAREYHPVDPKAALLKLPERLVSEGQRNVARVAGSHNPIPCDDKHFYPAALTRHCATVWFDHHASSNGWRKGK